MTSGSATRDDTKRDLRHYRGSNVGGLRIEYQSCIYNRQTALDAQRSFIDGVQGTLRLLGLGRLRESPGVGEPQLRRILETARTLDWTDPKTIRKLYQVYGQIIGETFDDSLFSGLE